jgi:hypothetical protein
MRGLSEIARSSINGLIFHPSHLVLGMGLGLTFRRATEPSLQPLVFYTLQAQGIKTRTYTIIHKT